MAFILYIVVVVFFVDLSIEAKQRLFLDKIEG